MMQKSNDDLTVASYTKHRCIINHTPFLQSELNLISKLRDTFHKMFNFLRTLHLVIHGYYLR